LIRRRGSGGEPGAPREGEIEFSFESAMDVLRGEKVGASAAVPAAAPTSVVAEPARAMVGPDEEFEAAWPGLARSLSGPKTVKALAGALGVPEPRLRSWLATVEAAGRVRRREKGRSWELIEPTLF